MPKLKDKKWVFTDSEIDEQIERGKELYKKESKGQPFATSFGYDPKTRIFSIRASDGSRIDFPVSKVRELQTASDREIGSAYITKAGDAIHWDALDAHYTVAGLAANIFGTQEWMSELGKKGGKRTSPAKVNAARLNGQKGGRPRSASMVPSRIAATAVAKTAPPPRPSKSVQPRAAGSAKARVSKK